MEWYRDFYLWFVVPSAVRLPPGPAEAEGSTKKEVSGASGALDDDDEEMGRLASGGAAMQQKHYFCEEETGDLQRKKHDVVRFLLRIDPKQNIQPMKSRDAT